MADKFVDWDFEWGKLISMAWADPAFKKRLLADPPAVLKEHGLVVPAGVQLKIVENTEKVINLVLPIKPAPEELSEEELHRVAGGHHHCHHSCHHRCSHERCGGCSGCGGCERCRC